MSVIAYRDEEVAREKFAAVAAEFDRQSPAAQALHHSMTKHVMQTLRAERDLFIGGRPLDDCPRLKVEACRLRFIPLTERNIEKEHAVVNQKITCPRHGPVLVSLARRLPMWESRLAQDPQSFKHFLELFDTARNTLEVPDTLGIGGHPVIQDAVRRRGEKTFVLVKVLSYVLYRADLSSQFPALDDARIFSDHCKKDRHTADNTHPFYLSRFSGNGVSGTVSASTSGVQCKHYTCFLHPDGSLRNPIS